MPITISGSTGIAGVDGSASTPAVQGTDTNTGIVFPAADTVTVATGGSERMRVDSSGNVGIGTSSPTQKLEVAGATFARIAVTETGSVVTAQVAANTVEAIFGSFTNHPAVLRTNNTERARFDTSGNFLFNSGYGSVATAYGCRAWVNFNGTGTLSIRGSGNVSSVTDHGTGDYTVNMTSAMPDVNYSYQVSVGYPGEPLRIGLNTTGGTPTEVAPTTSAFRFYTNNAANSAQVDPKYVYAAVFR